LRYRFGSTAAKYTFMKTTLFTLGFLLISQVAYLQSSVTIKTTGNRYKQLIVDGKTYAVTTTSTTGVSEIAIPDVAEGQHTIQLIRTTQSSATNTSKTSFTTREGYDLQLSIAANGSISTSETRVAKNFNNGGRGALSTTAYNTLLAKVKAKSSSTDRSAIIESQFTTSNKKLTSAQASQLIKLVNSESLRLKLAKLSYTRISDTDKFSLVSNLLNSTANKTLLNEYIATANSSTGTNDTEVALTTAEFNIIYQEVLAETTLAERVYYLTNFFDRETNFYTAAQANQLLTLITSPTDRSSLVPKAYRGVTDKANFSYNGTVTTPLPDANYTTLYNSVKNSYSTSVRYNLVSDAFKSTSNFFTVAQAKQLLSLINAENDRLPLAKNAWDNITDQVNYSQLYDLFSSSSNRSDLMAYVSTMQNGNTIVKVAMSDADYNTLYKNLQYSFGIGAKYSSLTEIFNTETNYFTVAQTKKLIQLVSTESNRLELAKLSYNNITDPTNFSQLYDIFSTQASKTALLNFVNSNASIN